MTRVLIMSPKKKSAYTVTKLKDFSAVALDEAVGKLLAALEEESEAVKSEAEKKAFRDRWMARTNGLMTQVNDLWLKAAPKDAKRDAGQRVNELKTKVAQMVEATSDRVLSQAHSGGRSLGRAKTRDAAFHPGSGAAASGEYIDITLPGIRRPLGGEHPV